MDSQPLQLSPAQRQRLLEYERLHAAWRAASATADRLDARRGRDTAAMRDVLQHRVAADQLHRQALQLVRSTPI